MTTHEMVRCPADCHVDRSDKTTSVGDIVIVSCDGVQFSVCRSKLHMHSDVFPGGEFGSRNELVHLSEDASTLALLFRYMDEQRQPDLRLLNFDQLSRLAEAAEKYQFSPTTEICRTFMRTYASESSVSVLCYAIRHGHEDLYKEILPHTFTVAPAEVLESLGDNWYHSWSLYRDAWSRTLLDARCPSPPGGILHKGGASECGFWHTFELATVAAIGQGSDALTQIPRILENHYNELKDCRICTLRAHAWQWRVEKSIAALPRFQA